MFDNSPCNLWHFDYDFSHNMWSLSWEREWRESMQLILALEEVLTHKLYIAILINHLSLLVSCRFRCVIVFSVEVQFYAIVLSQMEISNFIGAEGEGVVLGSNGICIIPDRVVRLVTEWWIFQSLLCANDLIFFSRRLLSKFQASANVWRRRKRAKYAANTRVQNCGKSKIMIYPHSTAAYAFTIIPSVCLLNWIEPIIMCTLNTGRIS